jgi:5'-deoxynucleotidase
MKPSHFYAMLSRMKYINRWGLMNNTQYENISEHSHQVAILAHCLVLLHNKRFGGTLNPERAALLATFHDTTEIITGDMPTPVKYANPAIRDVYRQIEDDAADRLLALLPADFREEYTALLKPQSADDRALEVFVKAADRFSALIKCIEELRMGNDEFRQAAAAIEQSLHDMHLPEAEVFFEEFLPSYHLALDELQAASRCTQSAY